MTRTGFARQFCWLRPSNRQARESGHPGREVVAWLVDSRFRGNDESQTESELAGKAIRTVTRRSPLSVLVALVLVCFACATVPYTKRSQLILLSESEEMQLGVAAYEEVLKKAEVVRDPAFTQPLQRVGARIARVADKPGYDWEFTVIDDPKQVNAFALPGGKVAVYTGLYPVAQDEAGLAVVVGHEVAHALARHGGERMSQGLVAQLAGVGLSVAVGASSPATRSAVMQAFGLGAQVGVLLPFGRAQESEADHIGMILMAKAGYDPAAALTLWQRMEARASGAAPPEFLSTHPGYQTRQENIRSWIDEARGYYSPDPNLTVAKLPAVPGR
jgi:predicted Zn-dependent protease